jgi:hypothetical protein
MSFYEELKGWQSGIGSLLGLLALVGGALFNFHLNRRRDAALQAEEKRSVAAAIYGELVLLRQEAAKLATSVAQAEYNAVGTGNPTVDSNFLEAHTMPEPFLYRALAAKLGLLDADILLAVAKFYANYREAQVSLPLLAPNEKRPYQYSSLSVLVPARDAVIDVVPTLNKIRQMLSLVGPVEDVDLGRTESFIEYERSRFESAE